jgi:hypothetical protein
LKRCQWTIMNIIIFGTTRRYKNEFSFQKSSAMAPVRSWKTLFEFCSDNDERVKVIESLYIVLQHRIDETFFDTIDEYSIELPQRILTGLLTSCAMMGKSDLVCRCIQTGADPNTEAVYWTNRVMNTMQQLVYHLETRKKAIACISILIEYGWVRKPITCADWIWDSYWETEGFQELALERSA